MRGRGRERGHHLIQDNLNLPVQCHIKPSSSFLQISSDFFLIRLDLLVRLPPLPPFPPHLISLNHMPMKEFTHIAEFHAVFLSLLQLRPDIVGGFVRRKPTHQSHAMFQD